MQTIVKTCEKTYAIELKIPSDDEIESPSDREANLETELSETQTVANKYVIFKDDVIDNEHLNKKKSKSKLTTFNISVSLLSIS